MIHGTKRCPRPTVHPRQHFQCRRCVTYDRHVGFIQLAIWGQLIRLGGQMTTVTLFPYPLLALVLPSLPPDHFASETTPCLALQLISGPRALIPTLESFPRP